MYVVRGALDLVPLKYVVLIIYVDEITEMLKERIESRVAMFYMIRPVQIIFFAILPGRMV